MKDMGYRIPIGLGKRDAMVIDDRLPAGCSGGVKENLSRFGIRCRIVRVCPRENHSDERRILEALSPLAFTGPEYDLHFTKLTGQR